MSVHVASTCYWETDPPTYVDVGDAPWSGRLNDLKGSIFRWRSRDRGTGFEAVLHRDSLLSRGAKPESLYNGPSLEHAVAALNARLDRLEHEQGYVPSPREELPKRLDPDALIVATLETETFVDRELERFRLLRERRERRGPRGNTGSGTPKL